MRRASLLVPFLALAACTRQVTIDAAPVVHAGQDLDAVIDSYFYLGATATSDHSTVLKYDWTLITAPDRTQASIVAKGSPVGSRLVLYTGDKVGLYVLEVTATDANGLTSEPDYVNLLLHPRPPEQSLELQCVSGCEAAAGGLEADEGATLKFTAAAAHPERVTSYQWEFPFQRDPLDHLPGAAVTQVDGASVTVVLPRVARPATLTVKVTALGQSSPSASLQISERNSIDEPPVLAFQLSRPDGSPVDGTTVVLPGDAVNVTAVASDPNGDAVSCDLRANGSSATRLVVTSPALNDPCRVTFYGLADGTFQFDATAATTSPAATTTASAQLAVSRLALDAGPALNTVAVDGAGRALAAGVDGSFSLWGTGAGGKQAFEGAASAAAAVALTDGATPELGLVGYAGLGLWSQLDVSGAAKLADLAWQGQAGDPTATRALAIGGAGQVFAATDRGLAAFKPGSGLVRWPATGSGIDVGAVAATQLQDGHWLVFYASGTAIYALSGEDGAAWPAQPPAAVGAIERPSIRALAAGPSAVPDLWVAAGSGAGLKAAGLILFTNSVDPSTDTATLNGSLEWFAQENGILSVAVEQEGPYAGDAWAVAGDRLVRVSRALQNGGAQTRPTVTLALDAQGTAKAAAVAVGGKGLRRVAVATDQGLLRSP